MIIVTTTEHVPNRIVTDVMGIVSGTDLYVVNTVAASDLGAQERQYATAIEVATRNMSNYAEEIGADAVIGMKTNFTPLTGTSSMMITVVGTAVKLGLTEEEKQRIALEEQKIREYEAMKRQQALEEQRQREAEAEKEINKLALYLQAQQVDIASLSKMELQILLIITSAGGSLLASDIQDRADGMVMLDVLQVLRQLLDKGAIEKVGNEYALLQ